MGFGLGTGTRIRKSVFVDATVAAGVTHFSTYKVVDSRYGRRRARVVDIAFIGR